VDLPLSFAIDLVFGSSDGVSSKHHPSKMTSLKNMVMGSPLLSQSRASASKGTTHPVKLADAEVLGSHKGRKGSSGLGSPSRLGGRSRLLDLKYISTWSICLEHMEEGTDIPRNHGLERGNPERG
jgi:hypothetical protein